MAEEIKVNVTAHEKYLIIETPDPIADNNFVPAGGGKLGCTLIHTKNLLGISKEAMDLIKTMKKCGDDLGDLNLWSSGKRGDCFGWLGPHKRLMNTENSELSRDSIFDIEHKTIENKIPLDAFEAIKRLG